MAPDRIVQVHAWYHSVNIVQRFCDSWIWFYRFIMCQQRTSISRLHICKISFLFTSQKSLFLCVFVCCPNNCPHSVTLPPTEQTWCVFVHVLCSQPTHTHTPLLAVMLMQMNRQGSYNMVLPYRSASMYLYVHFLSYSHLVCISHSEKQEHFMAWQAWTKAFC